LSGRWRRVATHFLTGSDFTPKLELNLKKGFKLFNKKLLKAPAPAFKSNPQLFNGVKISPRAKPGFKKLPKNL